MLNESCSVSRTRTTSGLWFDNIATHVNNTNQNKSKPTQSQSNCTLHTHVTDAVSKHCKQRHNYTTFY